MKPRFYLFVGIIILVAIVIVAAVAARNSPHPPVTEQTPTQETVSKTFTVTVKSEAGLSSLKVINQNKVGSCIILPTNLPFSFNCTQDDIITLNATSLEGYVFNSWFRDDGTFYNQNPYTMKVSSSLVITAGFIPVEQP